MSATKSFQTQYQALRAFDEPDEERDDAPTENIIHIVPDQTKSRWNHIEDLDEFFNRVYRYHQRGGFQCMVVEDFLQLFQFIFVVLFGVFLCTFVDYAVLFSNDLGNKTHRTFDDIVLPWSEARERFGFFVCTALTFGCVLSILSFFKCIYNVFKFWEIRSFYKFAMKITPNELVNMTWHEVQKRLLEAQREYQMCIHKAELTELDIYHRMLRFKNYMIAMVNKSVLPLSFDVPFTGQYVFLTSGLKYNLEMILFWGPWAPFENSWHLKKEYKSNYKRKELAVQLSRKVLWVGIANLVLLPIIFVYQIFYSFFKYAELVKRDPSLFGVRRWSLYARLFLRHFNELDHEFNARLSRGYRPAKSYMNIFTSPLLAIIAKHVAFVCASIVGVTIILTVIDQDVLRMQNALTVITLGSLVVTVSRQFIPDENMVFCPELLMRTILSQIHYIPDTWKGQAHTYNVRWEFSQLFPYTFTFVLEEVISPIITPFILIFTIRHKAQDIVDFFHNFTVDVTGVGDVCSFAQLNIKKHGHPEWNSEPADKESVPKSMSRRAEYGKTELSLMHFTLTNPEWRPQEAEDQFVNKLRNQIQRDGVMMGGLLPLDNPLLTSSHSSAGAAAYNPSLLFSTVHKSLVYPSQQFPNESVMRPSYASDPTSTASGIMSPPPAIRGGVRSLDYPSLLIGAGGVVSSVPRHATFDGDRAAAPSFVNQTSPNETSAVGGRGRGEIDEGTMELLSAEMNASALYLHDLHLWKMTRQNEPSTEDERARQLWQVTSSPSATTSPPPHGPSTRMPNIQEGTEEAELSREDGGRGEEDYLLNPTRIVYT